jgi:hypothetical protein
MQQRDQNTASRATQRVAQRNRASSRVHIVSAEPKDLGVRFDDCGEGLVEFPNRNVFLLEAGLLQQFFDARGRGNGEVDWVWLMSAYDEDVKTEG